MITSSNTVPKFVDYSKVCRTLTGITLANAKSLIAVENLSENYTCKRRRQKNGSKNLVLETQSIGQYCKNYRASFRLSKAYFSTFMIKPARLIPNSLASLDLFQPVRRKPSLIISRSSSSKASFNFPCSLDP